MSNKIRILISAFFAVTFMSILQKQKLYTALMIVSMFVINIYIFKFDGGIFNYFKMRNKLTEARLEARDAELMMNMNISSMIDLREMRVSVDTVETFARNRLFYGRKGEKIFICDDLDEDFK